MKHCVFSRMLNMQVLCPYYVKDHITAMLHVTDVWFYLSSYELGEAESKAIGEPYNIIQMATVVVALTSRIWLSNKYLGVTK